MGSNERWWTGEGGAAQILRWIGRWKDGWTPAGWKWLRGILCSPPCPASWGRTLWNSEGGGRFRRRGVWRKQQRTFFFFFLPTGVFFSSGFYYWTSISFLRAQVNNKESFSPFKRAAIRCLTFSLGSDCYSEEYFFPLFFKGRLFSGEFWFFISILQLPFFPSNLYFFFHQFSTKHFVSEAIN